jgi:hypothetical protein
MENKPSFVERTQALRHVAEELHAFRDILAQQLSGFADTIMLEVQRMEAAQSRFQKRVGDRTTQRAKRSTK